MHTANALNEHEILLVDEHTHDGTAPQPNGSPPTLPARVQHVDRVHA
ncbi:hypothetical protein [Cryobacterium sp. TMS1-13-1]|nr:hypothetical protein [Cryobacterium sp. TMS1-13-1]